MSERAVKRTIAASLRALLDAERTEPLEESVVCTVAEAALRLALPLFASTVTPAGAAPGERRERGQLDVRLVELGPDGGKPAPGATPVMVRVIVHDEIARGQWGEATNAIVESAKAAARTARERRELRAALDRLSAEGVCRPSEADRAWGLFCELADRQLSGDITHAEALAAVRTFSERTHKRVGP